MNKTEIAIEKAARKAAKTATEQSVRMMSALFLIVLCDKHGATPEEIKVFHAELDEYADKVSKGEVKMHDVYDVLKKEYGIEVGI